ncbi:MAG TPA: hypothetical protein VE913_10205 [Longimicrobium sp.]|nr:hypothetical protein [Longimicrobium sp.]
MFQLDSTVPPIPATARLRSAFRRVLLTLAMLAAALAAHIPGLQAQLTITCPDMSIPREGAPCALTVVGTDPHQAQRLRVRVMEGGTHVASAVVRFSATAGTLLPDSVSTDNDGYAQTMWYRGAGSATTVIAVIARTASASTLREIQMRTPYRLREHRRDTVAWFEKTQLPRPLIVEIIRADAANDTVGRLTEANSQECRTVRVSFSPIGGGSLTPDIARADLVDAPYSSRGERRKGCFAHSYWTLGEGPGYRHAGAALVGAGTGQVRSSVAFEARARAMPRLVGGILASRYRSYMGAKPGAERTIRIERTLPDGGKMSFDTVFEARDTVERVDGRTKAASFVGISTPLVPRARWLAVTVGVNPADLERDWYAGVSVLRIPLGLAAESLPVDLHILGHFGRSPVLKSQDLCASTGDCGTRERARWHGFAGMLSVDAGSLVTKVIEKLGGG